MRDYNSLTTNVSTYWAPLLNSSGDLFGAVGLFTDNSRHSNCMPDLLTTGYMKTSYMMVLDENLSVV